MVSDNRFVKTPMQHAFQYTLVISIIYAIFKFFDIDSPDGTQFISYIIPKLFVDVILIIFPILSVFFYFVEGNGIKEIKEKIFDKDYCQPQDEDTLVMLREYHNMLKEGIITQDEFDIIKKKYLDKLNKK